jgi:DNA polymerase-3 subunit delta
MLGPMADDRLQPAYFLTGTDRPKIRRAVHRLRARFPNESVELLSAESASGDDAVAALNALGLFAGDGPGRLVVVEGIERWKAEDAKAIAAYLSDPAPDAVLALVAGEPPRSAALADACATVGSVLQYDAPRTRDLPAWVKTQLELAGARADDDAVSGLVELVGDDLAILASEIDKLAAWAAGVAITRRDVEALVVPAHEATAWAVTDAWGARDLRAALAACDLALEQKDPFVVAIGLVSHVERVRAAQRLAEAGADTKAVAKALRVKEFPARKALGHAQNYAADELDSALVRLAELDAALKGASRLSGKLELERALVDLLSPRETRRPAAAR